jgi:hypothetical protein
MKHLSFAQFLMWYNLSRGNKDTTPPRPSPTTAICTPADLPAESPSLVLPALLHLTDGTVLSLRRKPRALDWAPKSEYADILLFTVNYLYFFLCLVISDRNLSQSWMDEEVDLGNFARDEAYRTLHHQREDTASGLRETRIKSVKRKLEGEFRL